MSHFHDSKSFVRDAAGTHQPFFIIHPSLSDPQIPLIRNLLHRPPSAHLSQINSIFIPASYLLMLPFRWHVDNGRLLTVDGCFQRHDEVFNDPARACLLNNFDYELDHENTLHLTEIRERNIMTLLQLRLRNVRFLNISFACTSSDFTRVGQHHKLWEYMGSSVAQSMSFWKALQLAGFPRIGAGIT